jgi:vancomycin permeability regulator SanA
VVCTQRFHLPRSLYLARSAGIDAVGLVADLRAYRGSLYNQSRERLARMRAWLDVAWARRGRARARCEPMREPARGRARSAAMRFNLIY